MPKMFTRKQYRETREARCTWSADDIDKALQKRFPGDEPIALEDVLDAWIADTRLPVMTLRHCVVVASRLLNTSAGGAWFKLSNPRTLLQKMRASLDESAEAAEAADGGQ